MIKMKNKFKKWEKITKINNFNLQNKNKKTNNQLILSTKITNKNLMLVNNSRINKKILKNIKKNKKNNQKKNNSSLKNKAKILKNKIKINKT